MQQKTNHANNVQYHSKKMPTHDTKGDMSDSLKNTSGAERSAKAIAFKNTSL